MELGEGLDGPSWMLEFTGGPLVRASWAMKEAGRLRGELLARMTQWATWRMLGDGPYRAWWASRAAARDLPARYRSEAEVDDWPFFGDRNAWYEVLLRGGVLREEVRAWILRSAAGGATWHYLDAIFMRDRAHTTEVAELAFRSERFIDAVASIDSARSPSQGGHGRSSHALEVETRILLWLGRYRDALRISAGAATPERLRACVRWGEPRAASEALSAWESSSRGSLSGEGGVSAFTEHHILLGIEMPGAISFRGEHPSWEQGLLRALHAEYLLLHGHLAHADAHLVDGRDRVRPRSYARALIEHTAARVALERGAFADADACLWLAIPCLSELVGERSHFVARMLATRGDLRVRQGRYAESAADLALAIDAMAEALPEDHPDLLEASLALARIPDRRDTPAAERALSALVLKLGEVHPRVRRLSGATRR